MNMGVGGMLEVKGYQCVNIVLLFVAGFIDRAMGFLLNALMTIVSTM